jgi:general secretion pathway protein A
LNKVKLLKNMNNSTVFFGFKKPPFSLTPDHTFYFLSKKHREVLNGIFSGIMQNRGVFLLTGEVGTGKTLSSRVLIEKLSVKFHTAYILNPFLTPDGMVKIIAEEFGVSTENKNTDALISNLHSFLIRSVKQGKCALVFIDEAQHLSDSSLEMLRVLSNLETNNVKLLQFILIGQNELIKKLSQKHLRQVAQRVSVKYELGPLSLAETHDYLFHRIKHAGGFGKIEFNRTSIYHIYKLTRGYPRSINILMDNVLNAACAKKKKVIDSKIIKDGFSKMLPFPLRFLPLSILRSIKGNL